MSRYFFALCLVAVITITVNAKAVQKTDVDDYDDDGLITTESAASARAKAVLKFIAEIAAGMAVSCVLEAAEQCSSYWKKPAAAIKCAGNFFKQNKGRCAVGK